MTTDTRDRALFDVLSGLVRALVDYPDRVQIEIIPDGATSTFRVLAHPSDIGKLIGVNGRTARALRTILGATAAKEKRSVRLDITDGRELANA